jgi:UrcA family protein
MKSPFISMAAAAALFGAAQAQSQSNPIVVEGGVPTVTVSYADLNIAVPAGRKALEGRVTRAASALCIENHRAPLDELQGEHSCFSQALNRARADIDLAVSRARMQLASSGTIQIAAR